jgi:hypothetical protein
MDKRVYYLATLVFLMMAVLLPTLTKQARDETVGRGYVLGESCEGVDSPRSDINCDGRVSMLDFALWRYDYLNPTGGPGPSPGIGTATPVPSEPECVWCGTSCIRAEEAEKVNCLDEEINVVPPPGSKCVWNEKRGTCEAIFLEPVETLVVTPPDEIGLCRKDSDCVACGRECVLVGEIDKGEIDKQCLDVFAEVNCGCREGACVAIQNVY